MSVCVCVSVYVFVCVPLCVSVCSFTRQFSDPSASLPTYKSFCSSLKLKNIPCDFSRFYFWRHGTYSQAVLVKYQKPYIMSDLSCYLIQHICTWEP